jgi:hypothetical protein
MTVQQQLFRLALRVSPGGTKKGQKFNDSSSAIVISTASNANPSIITTATAHGLVTGNQVYITGVATNTMVNNTLANPNWTVTVTGTTTFTIVVASNGAGTGGTCTPALIGSVGAANFLAQRLLDIYNEARFALANAIDKSYPEFLKATVISGTITKNAAFQFASGIATKPTGFIKVWRLEDSSGAQITTNPVSMIARLKDLESATNRMVFDYGTTFVALTGSTNVLDASTYILYYSGITNFSLSHVLDGTTVETFNDDWYPKILELAEAIASEQGGQSINALATQLVGASLK